MHLFHKVTAVGIARCIDNKQTYQLTQLFDDTIGKIINLFPLGVCCIPKAGLCRVIDNSYTADVVVDAILE